MNVFGVGPLEVLFILVLALIVVGPKDVGKFARKSGRFLNRLYRSDTWRLLTEASHNLRTLPNRLAREAALDELDDVGDTLRRTQAEVGENLQGLQHDLSAWMPPAPDETPPSAAKEPPVPPDTETPSE